MTEVTREVDGALPRDITRFKCLYPNGRAKLRPDPTPGFSVMSGIEAIYSPAPHDGTATN
jgi:hypothetical protein